MSDDRSDSGSRASDHRSWSAIADDRRCIGIESQSSDEL